MCSVTIGVMVAQGVGAMISAYGAYQQGQAQSAEAKFRSQIALNNKIIAEQNADAALDKGRADIEDERRRTAQKAGSQLAMLAAHGFQIGEGTSIEILADVAAIGELDVLRIQVDAENRARNFRIQAMGFGAEADLGRLASKSAEQAGAIGAAGSLITGAARVGTTFLDRKTTKPKKPKKP